MERTVEKQEKITLTDTLRARCKNVTDPIGAFLNRLGIMPNTITILGLLGNAVGAIFLAQGKMIIGGAFILAMGAFDALDGTMARLRGEASDFGAFVDSVTDRYSELVIFAGLIFYYLTQEAWLNVMVVYAAASGSVLVSYVRARGQSLGMDTKVGILTRFERYLVLAPTLLLNIPMWGIWPIAILANITAVQRIIDVRRQAHARRK